MSDWPSAVYGRWFVAARADKVREQPLAVTVLDRSLVLGRTATGTLFALEDRCPHRQAPLSQGRIVGEGIVCPYHGWTFGPTGRCVAVPGLAPAACLPAAGARAVALRELDGMVWVRLAAEGDAEPPALITSLPSGSRRFLWQTNWGANVVDAIENFLDPLHTHLVHPGLVRRDGARTPVQVRLERTGDGFMLDYAGQPAQTGLLYRLFESPRSSERAIFAVAGSAQLEYRYRNGSVVRITLHFTPASRWQTHVFTTIHVEGRWAPALAVRLFVWPFLKRVATQDQRILELQAANLQRFPACRGVSTELDLVRRYLEDIWRPEARPADELAARTVTILL